jgi:hypothetical protein
MFDSDIAAYVRRSYDTLEDACQAHAEAAVRLARWSTAFRVLTLLSTAVAAGIAMMATSRRPGWAVAEDAGAVEPARRVPMSGTSDASR